MSRHTPWTNEQSEKWAREYASLEEYPNTVWQRQGFLAGLAKAAEMIEAPTVYGNTEYKSWGEFQNHEDTHSAKLVGVRPIEGSEK